jgi:hypothetical protein
VSNFLGFKKYVSINNKLVINTSLGAERYAFLILDENVSNHLSSIQVRTLKADGSIVELDSSSVFTKGSTQKKFGAINYPIPSVEPGDTIETKYVYFESKYEPFEDSDNKNPIGYVNLNSYLHSLNSQFSIKVGPDEIVKYKTYNKFPEPAVIANDSLVYLQFSMDKVKGFAENEYNCLACEKPYLYYTLNEKKDDVTTWKDIYNQEFNALTQPLALDYEKKSYYKRWKRRTIGTAKDSSKFFKFKLLHQKILEDFNMQALVREEFIKSSGYFLKEERFDAFSIRRFYRQLLEDLEIDYWAVFGKSKRNGPIDTDYIRKGEFDHIFFAFKDDKDHLNFLYPHDEFYMYRVDEVPTNLYNTEAVLVKPYLEETRRKKDRFIDKDFKLSTVDSVSRGIINIPGMDYKFNYFQQTMSSEVDLDKKELNLRYRLKVSGGFFTDIKSFYSTMSKDEDMSNYYDALSEFEGEDNTIQIDTVINRIEKNERPFNLTLSTKGKLNNVITFINDNTVSLAFDKLLNHNQLETNPNAPDLDYYLDYSYSDNLLLYLNFPYDIEIVGIEDDEGNFKNEFGEYNFEVKKISDKQLQLTSNYKILKDYIPDERLEELDAVNEKANNAKNKRLIIKLKRD